LNERIVYRFFPESLAGSTTTIEKGKLPDLKRGVAQFSVSFGNSDFRPFLLFFSFTLMK
jgi:hypothetical protein